MKAVEKLYRKRFEGDSLKRDEIWRTLCGSFFQKHIGEQDAVLDLGAGYCEFINNIRCRLKYAVDLNTDTADFAGPEVRVFAVPADELSTIGTSMFDVVFMSNFLEHLRSREDVLKALDEVLKVLKPGGRVMVLQPNIRYAYKEYWDFFDHHIPLSDKSLAEALGLAGFDLELVIPRFLPYTTKSRLPVSRFLIKAYLKLPLAWKIMGKQMFVIARKG
jgi:SAM-dependent methyltransferase